ncbi:hypothetical protein [Nonomuraea sp. NPDC049709]|uniref:hypothetical protein n=1 Tax=Nonomuraea sp. NPDC049709 TaxID=3154736 RepID=UPI00343662EC
MGHQRFLTSNGGRLDADVSPDHFRTACGAHLAVYAGVCASDAAALGEVQAKSQGIEEQGDLVGEASSISGFRRAPSAAS